MKGITFELIENRRVSKGMTRKEFSAAVGISPATYWRFRKGVVAQVPTGVFMRMLEVLGIEVLFYDKIDWEKPVVKKRSKNVE